MDQFQSYTLRKSRSARLLVKATCGLRFASGPKRTPVEEFAFHGGEEALGHGVVVAVARGAGR